MNMDNMILDELRELKNDMAELKNVTLIGQKKALTVGDAALLTNLSKSHLYKMICYKQIPYYKGSGGKLV